MATKWLPRARISTRTAENRTAGRGASICGHPGARGGPNWPQNRPKSFLKNWISVIFPNYLCNPMLFLIGCWGYSTSGRRPPQARRLAAGRPGRPGGPPREDRAVLPERAGRVARPRAAGGRGSACRKSEMQEAHKHKKIEFSKNCRSFPGTFPRVFQSF